MNENGMQSWVSTAKANGENAANATDDRSVRVVRRPPAQSIGNVIMEVAEKLRPHLMKLFEGEYDDKGLLLQPAHIRGIALDMAAGLVKKHYNNDNAAA